MIVNVPTRRRPATVADAGQYSVLPTLGLRQNDHVACVLCGSVDYPTEEDVIPKWLLRAFAVERGSTTVSVREESDVRRQVGTLRNFKVSLADGLCQKCNNELLGTLEQRVQPVLEAMIVRGQPTTLNLADQQLLAFWAIKTVYLMELAVRQRYPGSRQAEGYAPSLSETSWLLSELEKYPAKLVEPPPRSMVWLACWDCANRGEMRRGSMVNYAPSSAPLPTSNGGEIPGQFTTLAIGYVVFQVFGVDWVEAEQREAKVWNPGPPQALANAVRLIWPHRLGVKDIEWPLPAFPNDDSSFDRLASWDGALRF